MLRREEELRLSDLTQKNFYKRRNEVNGIFEIVEELQRQICREFKIEEKEGLRMIRRADLIIGQERANELSFYRRENKCIDGPLKVGDVAPCVNGLYLLSEKHQLAQENYILEPTPGFFTVLVAGSLS
mmetsp:Transcript_6831/g.9555  ORF Transcript_6831/g.9555 Transcript_6831/m.9555 type:complete len:128 (+) Transcript_6831:725-1108(+)